MMPQTFSYRPQLDGIRGVAILMVMARHFYVPGMAGGGHVGVQVFFVLSGFLITTLLLDEHRVRGRINFARFYSRRARRLFPALAALLAMVLLITAVRGQLDHSLLPALFTAGYVANWTLAAGYPMDHLTHAWTLSVEEQFYLVWPLLLLVGLHLGRRAVSALIASVIAVLLIIIRITRPELNFALDRADGLMIGCLLAMVGSLAWRAPATVVIGAVSAFVLIAGLAVPFGDPAAYGWGLLVISLATAGLIGAAMQGGPVATMLSFRPLVFVGKISYSLYLWHFAVSWEVWPRLVSAGWGWAPTAAASAALSVVFALISWRYVEQPLRSKPGHRAPAPEPHVERTDVFAAGQSAA